MEENVYTVEQVLGFCVNELSNISIRMSDMDTIGTPVKNVINNLRSCIEAIEKENQQKNNKEEVNENDSGAVPSDNN